MKKKNPPLNPTQGSSAFLQSRKTREYLLSCNCSPYVFPMLHLPRVRKPWVQDLALPFGALETVRMVLSCLWKITNFQTFWSYLFCLIHWLAFSTFPAQSQGVLFISFTIFLPGKKANSLHWGGNHSLPKTTVTLPGDTIQGQRSGQRKRCPHVADESTVPPVHCFDT